MNDNINVLISQEEVEAIASEPITGLNAGATVKGKIPAVKGDVAVVDFLYVVLYLLQDQPPRSPASSLALGRPLYADHL